MRRLVRCFLCSRESALVYSNTETVVPTLCLPILSERERKEQTERKKAKNACLPTRKHFPSNFVFFLLAAFLENISQLTYCASLSFLRVLCVYPQKYMLHTCICMCIYNAHFLLSFSSRQKKKWFAGLENTEVRNNKRKNMRIINSCLFALTKSKSIFLVSAWN